MSQHHESRSPPSAEELAAFADGTLPLAERARVERWLAENPDTADDLLDLDDIRHMCQDASPLEPSEMKWHAILESVRVGSVRPRPQAPARTGMRRHASWVAALAAAAAVLLVSTLFSPSTRPPVAVEPPVAVGSPVVPFPVAANSDVKIMSVDAADVDALVVGDVPLRRGIVLAAPGEVSLLRMERDDSGDFPDVYMHPDSEGSPMISAPLAEGGTVQQD